MDGRRRQEAARGSRDELPKPGGATSCGGPRLSHRGKGRFAVGGSLRRKVRELRRLVPGGRQLPAEQLLLHTADYILRLSQGNSIFIWRKDEQAVLVGSATLPVSSTFLLFLHQEWQLLPSSYNHYDLLTARNHWVLKRAATGTMSRALARIHQLLNPFIADNPTSFCILPLSACLLSDIKHVGTANLAQIKRVLFVSFKTRE
ncbi:hypothetical protein C4D60_Mb08t23930 [Musa balbisiana]|uniref:Uncharacterized protein n=1 Tax=Musa balbisiana TaxID=52838 RepID=A0A4S8K636_MUSBA|nr:hypothetical protein C4D60_Mb08t23930 [Musa balbisiana]